MTKHTDTGRSGDLVARLRKLICHGNLTCDTLGDCDKAADLIEALEAENERLRGALSWAEDADPVLADAIRNRAGLGEKRDLPECFGSIEVTHPQSRAENCCDDCPVEGLCRAALGEKQ